jgi:hypothetical protein
LINYPPIWGVAAKFTVINIATFISYSRKNHIKLLAFHRAGFYFSLLVLDISYREKTKSAEKSVSNAANILAASEETRRLLRMSEFEITVYTRACHVSLS